MVKLPLLKIKFVFKGHHMRRYTLILFAAMLVVLAGCRTPPPGASRTGLAARPQQLPITVSSHTLRSPRPLVVHVGRIDLSRGNVEIVCAAAPDPDRNGPATTRLVTPTILFTNAALTLAINANAFAVVSPKNTGSAGMYVEQAHATFSGLAASSGRMLSLPQRHCVSFWTDARRRPRIGMPGVGDTIREGVAGFGRLLDKGAIVPKPSEKTLHPRSAVGFSADRRTLWLVVVDGRDDGVSEGMTTFELAEYMRGLGASEALNLDGGGSSVMLYAPPAEGPTVVRIVNRPSTRFLGQPVMRPIPVLLGIRLLDAQ